MVQSGTKYFAQRLTPLMCICRFAIEFQNGTQTQSLRVKGLGDRTGKYRCNVRRGPAWTNVGFPFTVWELQAWARGILSCRFHGKAVICAQTGLHGL